MAPDRPHRLPTLWHVTTYLFGVCLFSISFLVFLNSSVSFVITDIVGQKRDVGDAVGSLGFADELVAIIACPAWGMLSDRLGVRLVAVAGYIIVGLALIFFVQASNVYPQLLLARMFFALGGAACTTMVTAILPSIAFMGTSGPLKTSATDATTERSSNATHLVDDHIREVSPRESRKSWYQFPSSRLAGLVGLFTGCGALIALTLFLPLPSYMQKSGSTPPEALRNTYYIIGGISFVIGLLCLFGLRHMRGQEEKGIQNLFLRLYPKATSIQLQRSTLLPYWTLFTSSLRAASNPDICLAYIGGFVARASSVGISLFIPLLINNYFITSGRCNLEDPTLVKISCRAAYVLAAKLTGVSQLIALLLAPVYGYFSEHNRALHVPLLLAALAGIAGYTGLCFLVNDPDPSTENGSKTIYIWVSLIGASQIGAIVCSLGCISRGISTAQQHPSTIEHIEDTSSTEFASDFQQEESAPIEDAPLLSQSQFANTHSSTDRSKHFNNLSNIQGSIAGTYSLAGGFAILVLTKLGGTLFDRVSPAAPFVIMGTFNVLLLLGVLRRAAWGNLY